MSDAEKRVLRRKFLAINAYLNKKDKSQINSFTSEGGRKTNEPKLNIKAEIYEIGTKKTRERISKTKSWFSEKINRVAKPLARITKKKKWEDSNNIRNEKGDVVASPTGTTETKDYKRLL